MYFILSKVLILFIYPINWILLLLLIAGYTNRAKLRKRVFITAISLFLFFSSPLILGYVAVAWNVYTGPLPKQVHYSCAIVLGGFAGGIKDNDSIGHFNAAADRFIQALKLKLTGKVSYILISGGNGTINPGSFSEAVWVGQTLKEFNIADTSILIERKSRNTIENAKFSKIILERQHLQPPYLLVTSTWHMRRSAMIFKKEGVDITPYPCDIRTGINNTLTGLVPNVETIITWNIYIKEMLGYVANYFIK
jgi:uncharacterized SAM-binding protein YcdF (DUF218 family)